MKKCNHVWIQTTTFKDQDGPTVRCKLCGSESRANGRSAMREWAAKNGLELVYGRFPKWFKMKVRKASIDCGEWTPSAVFRAHLPCWFDHVSRVDKGVASSVIVQPYEDHTALARQFAKKIGCSVKVFKDGPWNEGTWLHEFYQEPTSLVTGTRWFEKMD